MKYTVEDSFENFKPWSGAVDAFERIVSEGKAAEADRYFEENEPTEGWTDTAINDLLWFEAEDIFKALGMKPDDTETHDADEIGAEWIEQNDGGAGLYELVRVEFELDAVRIVYLDRSDEDSEPVEESETLTAEEVADLFCDDCGEIDADARTVETW